MQYHTAKNLVMAISVEANELMDHFQWLTPEEGENYMQGPKRQEVIHELADVIFGILGFCDAYNIDLSTALEEKLKLVAQKYREK
jgi:NTP pyrophosphatase (non-canonical NTP hydrolase)